MLTVRSKYAVTVPRVGPLPWKTTKVAASRTTATAIAEKLAELSRLMHFGLFPA